MYGDSVAMSDDGRHVAFDSDASNLVPEDTNGAADVFVHDRTTGRTRRVSVANDGGQGDRESHFGSISDDGRYVAFTSAATNLVADDTNGASDVFVHDRTTRTTRRVSNFPPDPNEDGEVRSFSPAISGNGRYVAFVSHHSGYWIVYVHDVRTGTTTSRAREHQRRRRLRRTDRRDQ